MSKYLHQALLCHGSCLARSPATYSFQGKLNMNMVAKFGSRPLVKVMDDTVKK